MTLNDWLLRAGRRTEDAPWLATKALGKDRAWIAANRAVYGLKPSQTRTLDVLLRRRLKGEPLAYILGTAPFYGREFVVDTRVLIPRPETEDLVEEALKIPSQTYVDVGTGSGAIAVTLAVESPRSVVLAGEPSAKALAVAKKNAKKLGARVKFFKGSLLHPALRHAIKGSVTIVANLPYLPLSDRKVLQTSVTKYEPGSALFAKDEGMALNKKLLEQIASVIPAKAGIQTLLELDPPQSQKLLAFAKSLFPAAHCSIIKDRCGRDRILKITLPAPQTSRRRS